MTERKFERKFDRRDFLNRRDFLKGIALGATSVGLVGVGLRDPKEGTRAFVSEVSASENGLVEFPSPEEFSPDDGWEKFTWQEQEILINQGDGWLATKSGDFVYSMENQLWVGTWLTPEWKKYRGAEIFGHPISDSQEKTLPGRYIQAFENLVVGVKPGERDSVHFVDIGREMCPLSLQKEDAEIAGEFRSFWDTGGERVLEKPISERLTTEDNVVTQYFENGKLNFNPKTGLVSLENLGEAWSKKKTQEGVLEKPPICKFEDLLPSYIEEIKKGENPNIIYVVIARTLWESRLYEQRGVEILEKRFFEERARKAADCLLSDKTAAELDNQTFKDARTILLASLNQLPTEKNVVAGKEVNITALKAKLEGDPNSLQLLSDLEGIAKDQEHSLPSFASILWLTDFLQRIKG